MQISIIMILYCWYFIPVPYVVFLMTLFYFITVLLIFHIPQIIEHPEIFCAVARLKPKIQIAL